MQNTSWNSFPFRNATLLTSLSCAAVLISTPAVEAQPKPPPGFTALFNGKDLAGWHGMPHFDPRKLWEMKDDERAKKITEWNEEFKKHWRVENGELVNDG